MSQYIAYNPPIQTGETLALATDTTEKIVLTVTNASYLQKSQFSAYWDIALGNHTSMKLRYYFTTGRVSGGNIVWYQVPAKNVSTGVLGDIPSVVDSTSPAQSSNIRLVEDFGVSGATGYKITAQGVGGTAGTINSLTVMNRDN